MHPEALHHGLSGTGQEIVMSRGLSVDVDGVSHLQHISMIAIPWGEGITEIRINNPAI